MTDKVTEQRQILQDKNCIKLGKKITDIVKINDHTWNVLDHVQVSGKKIYYKIETDGRKITCDKICSSFKWERNLHPNCKHIQAVILYAKKKFKAFIPHEREIMYEKSDLEIEINKLFWQAVRGREKELHTQRYNSYSKLFEMLWKEDSQYNKTLNDLFRYRDLKIDPVSNGFVTDQLVKRMRKQGKSDLEIWNWIIKFYLVEYSNLMRGVEIEI